MKTSYSWCDIVNIIFCKVFGLGISESLPGEVPNVYGEADKDAGEVVRAKIEPRIVPYSKWIEKPTFEGYGPDNLVTLQEVSGDYVRYCRHWGFDEHSGKLYESSLKTFLAKHIPSDHPDHPHVGYSERQKRALKRFGYTDEELEA